MIAKIIDPYWITGFTDGKGCFQIFIINNKKTLLKKQVQLEFTITQKTPQILYSIKNYFGCGYVVLNNKKNNIYCYRVRKLKHINNYIVPFFNKFSLKVKNVMYKKFLYALHLLNNELHLTQIGLNKLIKLQSEINRKKFTNIKSI